MRLIDADALLEKKREMDLCFAVREVDIEEAPTIEAEPVRHGRWEHTHEGVYLKVRCIACGVDAITANTDVCDSGGLLVKWAYCPNCGAKMDGGAADDQA